MADFGSDIPYENPRDLSGELEDEAEVGFVEQKSAAELQAAHALLTAQIEAYQAAAALWPRLHEQSRAAADRLIYNQTPHEETQYLRGKIAALTDVFNLPDRLESERRVIEERLRDLQHRGEGG